MMPRSAWLPVGNNRCHLVRDGLARAAAGSRLVREAQEVDRVLGELQRQLGDRLSCRLHVTLVK